MVELCDIVYVLTLDGWKESVGVTAELELARKLETQIIVGSKRINDTTIIGLCDLGAHKYVEKLVCLSDRVFPDIIHTCKKECEE
jgi:hypothetical protein